MNNLQSLKFRILVPKRNYELYELPKCQAFPGVAFGVHSGTKRDAFDRQTDNIRTCHVRKLQYSITLSGDMHMTSFAKVVLP